MTSLRLELHSFIHLSFHSQFSETMATKVAVRIGRPELIVPAKPTPHEIKLLSDIDDQQSLRYHYPTIMFYEDNQQMAMEGKDPVRVIKEALAEALVYYYPYAGRLIEGQKKKLMVNCTAEGVVFVEGTAEVTLEQLRNSMLPPCPGLEEFLLDINPVSSTIGCPLMSFQVTRLRCGGFVIAVLLNHVMSDGLGKVQFLNAVTQMAKGSSSPSPLPTWGRELFLARNPPLPSFFSHNEFDIVVRNDDKKLDTQMAVSLSSGPADETLIRKSFFFGPKEIMAMKDQLPSHMKSSPISKFKLITAFLWRSRTKALNLDENEVVTLTFFLNFRFIKRFQELPDGYYGNAVVSTAAVTSAKTLCNNPLSYAVELMTKAMEKVNGDYVKSYFDFMAFYGKPAFLKNRGAWVVSDSSRVGFDKVDFGWGKPVYGGPMDGGSFSYISVYSPVQRNAKEAGVMAPICLPISAMDKLKEEVRKLSVSKHTTLMSML